VSGRILILTASIGAGHDLPAWQLAEGIETESPATEVVVRDGLRALGRPFVLVNERAPSIVFFRFRFLWDAAFWLFVRFPPTRHLTKWLVWSAGARGLLRLVREIRPDAIVSVYPMTTEVLGRLRRTGKLELPVCAAITDLAMMHYWAAPGVDLHLLTHPESEREVRLVAGDASAVRAVRGLTRPEFAEPFDSAAVRRTLDLPSDGKVVLVSGGGWGVGDLDRAVATALEVPEVAAVVCLCGRNDALRKRLGLRFTNMPRVRVEGFTERMADWLAATDALVHTTGGLTVLEAHMRGCPTISFGWGRGHLRANNAAFARYGLAEVADSPAELRRALARALQSRRAPDRSFAALPTAASLVLALVSSLG